MGSIGNGQPARTSAIAWTTISDEPADSSANWMSSKLLEQARARETTPGTLNYTPASNTPAQNVAPWNSWLTPNCWPPPQAGGGAAPATDDSAIRAAAVPGPSRLVLVFGALVAAASATYLINSVSGRR